MPDSTPSFRSVLNFPERLFTLYQQKINQQAQLLNLIRRALPNELKPHANYCVLNGSKIILYTDSAAWSSQLRFFHRHILTDLKQNGFQFIEVLQIRLTTVQAVKRKESKPSIPDSQTIEAIRQQGLAQQDRKLNSALLKLSDTLSKLAAEKADL